MVPRTAAPSTQAEFAYRELRRSVVTGALPANSRVLQTQLADELGVSVTPVREAIRRLESDGLLESSPHKGVRVRSLRLGEAEEIYAMRRVLEPLQIRRGNGRLTPAAADECRRLYEVMAQTDDILEFAELNLDFHRLVMVYDDSFTSRHVEMLASVSSPYVAMSFRVEPELMRTSNEEHVLMLEAALAGDAEEHVRLELAHLEGTIRGVAALHEAGHIEE